MKHSDATGRFYAENAQNYARHTEEPSRHWLDRFLRKLSSGAEILELGCGNGRDSAGPARGGSGPFSNSRSAKVAPMTNNLPSGCTCWRSKPSGGRGTVA